MISRHNYEEFFLMYVDNELSAGERAEVELFVQQNADLAVEFEILQQTVLPPEDRFVFEDKNILEKSVNDIGAQNYEEYFLLYVDKELNKNENESVEKFVLQHPQFQDAFTLLKQTVLEPEAITFPDKQSLYRKEERRVIPMAWKQFAVAAALAGFAILMWLAIPGEKENISGQTAVVEHSTSGNNKVSPTDTNKNSQPGNNTIPDKTLASTGETELKDGAKKLVKKETTSVKNTEPANNRKANRNIPVSATPQQAPDEDAIAYNSSIATNPGMESGNDETLIAYENTQLTAANNTVNNYTQTVVYHELNTNDESANSTVYLGSMGLNKNKVRGIMKKVGGLFSGKSKEIAESQDGKLQVAGFELNTK